MFGFVIILSFLYFFIVFYHKSISAGILVMHYFVLLFIFCSILTFVVNFTLIELFLIFVLSYLELFHLNFLFKIKPILSFDDVLFMFNIYWYFIFLLITLGVFYSRYNPVDMSFSIGIVDLIIRLIG